MGEGGGGGGWAKNSLNRRDLSYLTLEEDIDLLETTGDQLVDLVNISCH